MSKAWADRKNYNHYRKVREYVLLRDRYLCQIQVAGEWRTRTGEVRKCLVTADCVHHTQGRAQTGDDPRYLEAACTPCNLRIGDPTKKPDPIPLPFTPF